MSLSAVAQSPRRLLAQSLRFVNTVFSVYAVAHVPQRSFLSGGLDNTPDSVRRSTPSYGTNSKRNWIILSFIFPQYITSVNIPRVPSRGRVPTYGVNASSSSRA